MSKFTEAERRFLERNELGRLATVSRDGTPHVVPVGYVFRSGTFWVAIDYDSKKCRNLRANKRVAFVVDSHGTNRGILVQGTAELIERGLEFRRVYDVFYKKFSWVRADPWKEEEAPFIKITPTRKASWRVN